MPSISKKGLSMPESPIRKLVPFAEAAAKKGKKIYQLNIGQPDIKTPEIAMQAVRDNSIEVLSYSHSAGFASYREKLAKYYERNDIHVTAEDIIVTTGGSEALLFAMGTITDPGDEVIIPEPFYANYNGFATSSGVTIVPIKSSIENNFALPPISEFEKLITENTKAILLCNPGNPTGYLYTKEEVQQIADLAIKHDLFVVADEVYREFTYDGVKHNSIMSIPELANNAIMVDSVSKRFSMCGARIGCLVSKNKEVITTAMKFAQARLSPPTLAQIASEAALDTPQEYFEEVNKEYTLRRNILVEGLEKIKGVKVAKPKGAFYCIAELPIKSADDFAQWLLEDFEFEGETIMVAPAAGFYSTPNTGLNQVRIAYVLKRENLERALQILEVAIKQYTSK
ncbi:MAG: pyridoxal phosphate-dependent aminotransferase [Zunongwangia sp.]|uniref:Aminotransferase n=2 Tax=Zunongwangia profunda TaxID=398743 RepID=D5BLC4_ZUNPS|nr:pyridoxal phosphate-dependent aminotransferase [Zunongwangia profunda]MAC65176.1 pyridoxal phosphate-dependent aminotransferase [Flavobacteriaceae bacterium]MAO37167.1 pyridoxal phosphate-dependent aminotransferase [Zunongwangia sp.]ADF54050.1 aspartate aminotransferase [Zunongwangia profunda SM-A87]MAG88272.1 pyridoxal phosphate-dependent aminotransferase [Flavobacteriaceae bacterium]MAS72386.1 pyridoxal phosphate-dependent aminotransferase [Zunongwangia sp.]